MNAKQNSFAATARNNSLLYAFAPRMVQCPCGASPLPARLKGRPMTIADTLVAMRKERNLTQQDVARKLFVTRQAVSRWENGETTPGIDMCKLISATFDLPVTHLLEMPDGDYCQSCGMPFYQPKDHGSEADGALSADYCSWCYRDGAFVEDESLEELIERCAPYMAESCHVSRDEAVSFMGALLPHLKRWK